MKTCKKCHQIKEDKEFSKDISKGCRSCRLKLPIAKDGHKICSKCNKEKTFDKFYITGRVCKECSKDKYLQHREKYLKRSKENQERIRDLKYKRKYGISLEEYNKILEQQNNSCAICNKTPKDNKQALAVDHCHKTGKVRGLLCKSCNVALGLLGDNIEEIMKRLEMYIT